MADYPRIVEINDERLKSLLQEKTELVMHGRELSQQIEDCENDMAALNTEILEHEKMIDVSDIDNEAREIKMAMKAITLQMQAVNKKYGDRLRAGVPATYYEQYEAREVAKKKLEEERNKIALKVQKKNDKIIPLGRKLMQPFLQDEYEDFESLRLEEGRVVGAIFSHMATFIEHFAKKRSAKMV